MPASSFERANASGEMNLLGKCSTDQIVFKRYFAVKDIPRAGAADFFELTYFGEIGSIEML